MKTAHDSETPAHGKQVITACAFIHRTIDGTTHVFLPKRADTKKFLPGVYELPGGHIDFGEDIVTGLSREVQEEFSMTIRVGDPFAAFTYTNAVKGSHSVEVIYFATFVEGDDAIRTNPDDHASWGWFTEADVPHIASVNRRAEDPEIRAIMRGFALLRGNPPNFTG